MLVRESFLWWIAAIYLFAFTSFYLQIPGLYGKNGIIPVDNQLDLKNGNEKSIPKKFSSTPTLLWFMGDYGLDAEQSLELLSIVGMLLAWFAMITPRVRNAATFLALWIFYLSIFKVGTIFLWFQWDILLLETGFLAIFVAPFALIRSRKIEPQAHDNLTMWLIKWLLFRLMFASGVVKLTSECPTWWKLTALTIHYESQCIPTPLAWYAHQLPVWFQKFSVVMTYVIEIALPFLFFSPIRSLRLISFYGQLLLQILIILTGNYNFFNLLTIGLCISLLDENYLAKWFSVDKEPTDKGTGALPTGVQRFIGWIKWLLTAWAMLMLCYWVQRLFTVRFMEGNQPITCKIAFTKASFNSALVSAMPITVWIGSISLLAEILTTIKNSIIAPNNVGQKFFTTLKSSVYIIAAIVLFCISLNTHCVLDPKLQKSLSPVIKKWYDDSKSLEISNPYGLFRSMTGVGGRPEVVIEGSDNLNSGWKKYEFYYKPGNVRRSPPAITPHQPRLDWQMWFLALGSYDQNPWFKSFLHRLLTNQKEVVELLQYNPFPDKPPKYIRSKLYHYHYTRYNFARGYAGLVLL
ncbi:uncharacterized protein TRIADDRAFT_18249 [Trichoplax adhaerens]|uniref:Lipase maturation factor n=1 Tax=Trichoplax adhaerens TaxID=10228 RepID=B3RLU7_TRIAD|nr:hypothetical protein TRIADDRAFT_18249 [Trichoplax adhaerens]EDV28848.1 hypothetical protein TRIADDRAFT_18249 [Trichoplax adhaerens]|eukprot:XP_002108050.1 hypothetical protein TRIADDRAFT_18249 [Trichoplax adhaerens]